MSKKKFKNTCLGLWDRARAEANIELLKILSQYLMDHPNERFGQALRNLGIVSDREVAINAGRGHEYLETIWDDEFSTEPQVMLKRVKETVTGVSMEKIN